jgi:ADP-ribose pyrophosphatase YjhB (NUDIX family)
MLPPRRRHDPVKFCSECGQALITKRAEGEGPERLTCGTCGTVHYENPRVIVCGIVHRRGSVLMCRRAQDPARGKWSLPGGYLECGETMEQATARETLEETGVVIDPTQLELYAIMNMPDINQVAVSFRIELDADPAIQVGPECLEVAFLSETDTSNKPIAWRESMGESGDRFFAELRTHEYSIVLATIGSRAGAAYRSREYPLLRPSKFSAARRRE